MQGAKDDTACSIDTWIDNLISLSISLARTDLRRGSRERRVTTQRAGSSYVRHGPKKRKLGSDHVAKRPIADKITVDEDVTTVGLHVGA